MPEPPDPTGPLPSPGEIAEAGPFPRVEGVLDRALALVEYLREHCPWDRRQTARSLVPHLLEETHEAVEAIRREDPDALRGELGDLLLNLAFQVVVAEDEGRFTREEVVRVLEEKMVRRHPHLFGLGEAEKWEAIKARERMDQVEAGGEAEGGPNPSGTTGILAGMAPGLDPLLLAHRIQERVAGVGFDWDEPAGALEKVKEELAEVEETMEAVRATAGEEADEGERQEAARRLEEEMGDLLFAVVNLARLTGAHAVPSLELANVKFRRRFERLEALARERGVRLGEASLDELDRIWDEVKGEE